jgi:hypothetical protein
MVFKSKIETIPIEIDLQDPIVDDALTITSIS